MISIDDQCTVNADIDLAAGRVTGDSDRTGDERTAVQFEKCRHRQVVQIDRVARDDVFFDRAGFDRDRIDWVSLCGFDPGIEIIVRKGLVILVSQRLAETFEPVQQPPDQRKLRVLDVRKIKRTTIRLDLRHDARQFVGALYLTGHLVDIAAGF